MSTLNTEQANSRHQGSITLPIEQIASVPEIRPRRYFQWKGMAARVLAAILLIPGAPIIALSVLLVRLTSRGPGIYRQTRVGKDGRLGRIPEITISTRRFTCRPAAVELLAIGSSGPRPSTRTCAAGTPRASAT